MALSVVSYNQFLNIPQSQVQPKSAHHAVADECKENYSFLASGQKSVAKSAGATWREKFKRATLLALHLYKGVSNGARSMGANYQAEVIDQDHRYGRNLHPFFAVWKEAKTDENFTSWMKKVDLGQKVAGSDELIKQKLLQENGVPISIPKVRYLTDEELKNYELQVASNGQIFTKAHASSVFDSKDGTKESSFVFVISQKGKIYLAPYSRGSFNHSSFLQGKAVSAAGVVLCKEGRIHTIWDDSGHYNIGFYDVVGSKETHSKNHMLRVLQAFEKKGISLQHMMLKINQVDGKAWKIKEISALEFVKA